MHIDGLVYLKNGPLDLFQATGSVREFLLEGIKVELEAKLNFMANVKEEVSNGLHIP